MLCSLLKQLGKDTSENNGKWAIPVGKNLTSGAYYATVAKRGKCKAAKSQVLTSTSDAC